MAERIVDLRSDTVTQPTSEMRRAMAEAVVGDDVFGEDPTVNELQRRAAEICGAEAALFVPSGSMGNLVSLRAMAQPGDEIICHEGAHFLHYEVGSIAAVAGVSSRPLAGRRGVLDPDDIAKAVRPPMYTYPRTVAIAVENTHNLAGGAVYPIEDLRGARKVADEFGLKIHLDGARIFNASVASGVPVSDYNSLVDTLTFCFSKGLGAPVGSIVVGSQELITKAHRYRKMHGGGMRQAGVLAAAALVAIDTMIERLAEDHGNATRLAQGLADLRADACDPGDFETNMVLIRSSAFGFTPQEFVAELAARGVLFLPYQPGFVRMVTHKDVSTDDIEFTLEQVAQAIR